MPQHVFAWLAGFGQCVIPWAPFRIERLPGNPRGVICSRSGVWTTTRLEIELSATGGTPRLRASGWPWLRQRVAEVLPGRARGHLPPPPTDGWQIQCELFVVPWPEGFALRSTESFPPPFDLEGPGESCLWVQGPVTGGELPPLAEMKTDEQRFVAEHPGERGAIAEFEYEHEGIPHCMFQGVIPYVDTQVLVVTGQCPVTERDLTLRGVRELAGGLIPTPPPPEA